MLSEKPDLATIKRTLGGAGDPLYLLWGVLLQLSRFYVRSVSVKLGRMKPVSVDDYHLIVEAFGIVLDRLLEPSSHEISRVQGAELWSPSMPLVPMNERQGRCATSERRS